MKEGLDVNQKGIRGARPLHYAAWGNYHECAAILVGLRNDPENENSIV